MKNVVVMLNFKENDSIPNPPFADNCAKSWEVWCNKNNVDFFVVSEKIHSFYAMTPQMQKMYTLDILSNSGVEFDQIAQVDYDVFVIPDCPNFFNMSNHEFCAVLDGGFVPQLNRQIQMMKRCWFPDSKINWDTYFNSGFIIYNKKHKPAFDDVIKFHETKMEQWKTENKTNNMTDDQTLLNFFIEKYNFPVVWFPRSYNVLDPWNRYFFFDGLDSLGHYINSVETIRQCVNIFHFCGDTDYRNRSTQFLREKLL